jgi:hypothetical protein
MYHLEGNIHETTNLVLKKSSFSFDTNCVEVARTAGGGALIRDTKNRGEATLRFTAGEWDAFIKGVKHGEFD